METFQQIINGDKPVLIDFYATWCGPCKAMSPIVEAIGKEVQGSARVLKIDVDRNPAIASQYGIQAVPTFMIFKRGQVVWRQPGGADKMTIKNELMRHV
ncbi:MAG: thioredoxin [Paludibacter sp.]